jgi:hypothetical protein
MLLREDRLGLRRGQGQHDVAGDHRRAVLDVELDAAGQRVHAVDPGAERDVEVARQVLREHVDTLREGEPALSGAERGREGHGEPAPVMWSGHPGTTVAGTAARAASSSGSSPW